MSGNFFREIQSYMKDEGFYILREGSHLVWSNGVHVVVTARTPSCPRALKNIKAHVRRLKRMDPGIKGNDLVKITVDNTGD